MRPRASRRRPLPPRTGALATPAWRAVVAAALSAGSLAACTRICADGVEPDGRYRTRIVESWREGGAFRFDARYLPPDGVSCGRFDGLEAGVTVELVAVGEVAAGECNDVVARVEKAPPAVSLGVHRGGGEGIIAATHEVTVGACAGWWQLALRAVGSAHVFAAPKPGELPPVIVTRTFQPRAESPTCRRCADLFVTKLEKR